MEERKGKIIVNGQEPQPVVIIDNGEGSNFNHDKVEIIYIANE